MATKIGVLTTFYSKNYGAALQAFALCQALNNLGANTEIVNYHKLAASHYTTHAVAKELSERSIYQKLITKIKNFKIKCKGNPKLYYDSEIRNEQFERFVKSFLAVNSERFESSEEFLAAIPHMAYDVFVCGSDQIWNPIMHGYDPIYYLNFETSAKKVAYAPSIAYSKFDDDELARIGLEISSVDSVSIRETSSAKQLQPFVEKEITTVIDPTFLLTSQEWKSIRSNYRGDEKYILVYILNYNEYSNRITRLVSDFAKKHKYKIICLPYTNNKFSSDVNVEYRYDVAPNDFIHLVSNACLIITNSFHATAISINLNRDFFVVSSKDRNHDLQVRLSDLLEKFKLENRRLFSDTTNLIEDKIDYSAVNEIIDEQRKSGLEYLKNAIGESDIGKE